jgi:hypothetical protein
MLSGGTAIGVKKVEQVDHSDAEKIARETADIAKSPGGFVEEVREIIKMADGITKARVGIAKEADGIAREAAGIVRQVVEIAKEPREIAKEAVGIAKEGLEIASCNVEAASCNVGIASAAKEETKCNVGAVTCNEEIVSQGPEEASCNESAAKCNVGKAKEGKGEASETKMNASCNDFNSWKPDRLFSAHSTGAVRAGDVLSWIASGSPRVLPLVGGRFARAAALHSFRVSARRGQIIPCGNLPPRNPMPRVPPHSVRTNTYTCQRIVEAA